MNPLHPTRRRWLKTLGLAIVAAPLARLAQRALRKPRLVRAEDLSSIPWIGHC